MLGVASVVGLALALAFGTMGRPAVAYAAVVCLYGLKQWGQDSSPWFADHRVVPNLIVSLIVALGLIRVSFTSIGSIRPLSTEWLLTLALYVYALLSLLWTPDITIAAQRWQLQAPYIVLIAFLSPFLIISGEDIRRMCDWTIAVGGTLCALTLFAGHWGDRGLLVIGDIFEQETNPLALASLAGTVCVLSLLSLTSSLSRFKKLLHILILPIAIGVLLRSGSRGQLVAAAVAVLVGLPLAVRRLNFWTWALIILASIVITALAWWIWERLGISSSRWTSMQFGEDASNRLAVALHLLTFAIDSPVTMIAGLGNSSAFHFVGFYPHITGLEILAEEGLVGAGFYVSILVVATRSAWQLVQISRNKQAIGLSYAFASIIALFVFELLLSFKQGALLSSVNVFSYAAILGRMCVRENVSTAKTINPQKSPPYANIMQ